jgi:hypothetical protein
MGKIVNGPWDENTIVGAPTRDLKVGSNLPMEKIGWTTKQDLREYIDDGEDAFFNVIENMPISDFTDCSPLTKSLYGKIYYETLLDGGIRLTQVIESEKCLFSSYSQEHLDSVFRDLASQERMEVQFFLRYIEADSIKILYRVLGALKSYGYIDLFIRPQGHSRVLYATTPQCFCRFPDTDRDLYSWPREMILKQGGRLARVVKAYEELREKKRIIDKETIDNEPRYYDSVVRGYKDTFIDKEGYLLLPIKYLQVLQMNVFYAIIYRHIVTLTAENEDFVNNDRFCKAINAVAEDVCEALIWLERNGFIYVHRKKEEGPGRTYSYYKAYPEEEMYKRATEIGIDYRD